MPADHSGTGDSPQAAMEKGLAIAPFLAQSHRDTSGFLPLNHYDLFVNGEQIRVRSALAGEHQRRNIALAIAAAVELRNYFSYELENRNQISNKSATPANFESQPPNLAISSIEKGIATTTWPGRLEFLPPDLLLDVAHNPAGAWTLRAAIATLPEDRPRTLIFSCLRDKDLTEMARILFPLFDSTGGRSADHIVFAPINNPRAASLEELLKVANSLDVPALPAQSTTEAVALARAVTPAGGLIIATGSIYLVGAVRQAVLGK
jgi:dihydrofolate synthase / folylpolyglutamate synthase